MSSTLGCVCGLFNEVTGTVGSQCLVSIGAALLDTGGDTDEDKLHMQQWQLQAVKVIAIQ